MLSGTSSTVLPIVVVQSVRTTHRERTRRAGKAVPATIGVAATARIIDGVAAVVVKIAVIVFLPETTIL